jgi:hypothetical protein
VSAQVRDELPDRSTRLTLRFPRGLGMSDVVLLADGSLRLGRGVVVNPGKEGRGMVANLGKGATEIGDGAKAGPVVGMGPVRVAAGAQITGDVRGAGSVDVATGAKVMGTTRANALLLPLVESSWTVHSPGKADSDVLVANDQTKKLAPGAYRAITVHDGGVLQLTRGDYFVGSLKVEGKGRIEYQGNEYWPVVMYVSGAALLNGKVGKEKGAAHFLLVSPKVRKLVIGQFFSGTVLAANARLILGGKGTTLRGGFVARDIEVLPGTVLEPSPFALDTFRWKGWVAHKDDDRDRVPDYLDACPADGKKRVPGACGCSVPDADADGDGIPDCLARLRRMDLPTCPPGKTCPPAASCRAFPWRESVYWLCADKGGVPRSDAAKACAKAGMSLASFASPEEGRFLARLLPAPAWVASSSRAKACRALDDVNGAVIEAGCGTKLGFVCQYQPRLASESTAKVVAPEARTCVAAAAAGFPPAGESRDEATAAKRPALEAFKRQLDDAKQGRFAGLAAQPPAAGSVCLGSASAVPCDEVELCAKEEPRRASLAVAESGRPAIVTTAELFPSGLPSLAWSKAYNDPPLGKGVGHSWCRMSTQNPTSLAPVHLDGLGRAVRGRTQGLSVTLAPDVSFAADPMPYPFGEVEPNLRGKVAFDVAADADGFLGFHGPLGLLKGTLEIAATRCSLRAGMTELRVLGDETQHPAYIPWIDSDDPQSPLHAKAAACERALRRFLHYADYAKKSFRDGQQLAWQLHQAKGHLDEDPLCKSIAASEPIVEGFPGGPKCYANEPIEAIASRFSYFYNPAGLGVAAGLETVAHALWTASAAFGAAVEETVNRGFVGEMREATHTVATIPLGVGSIPVNAKIDLTVRYAIFGRFEVDWKFPLWLEGPPEGTSRLVRVAATVAPTVSASLGVSAGIDPDYAGLGIAAERGSAVTLANATLPMFVEAALDREASLDTRPLPADVREPIALKDNDFVFGAPKRHRFTLAHEHGAGVEGSVLSGDLQARVRVPMGSFERVFNLPIARLRGESGHFDLADAHAPSGQRASRRSVPGADGGSPLAATLVVAGANPIGISEAELPLMFLESSRDDRGSRYGAPPVDMAALERVFYDDLCRPKPGEPCLVDDRRAPACQTYSECVAPKGQSQGVCEAKCRDEQHNCKRSEDCCQGLVCNWLNQCAPCVAKGKSCREDKSCCPGLTCDKKSRSCKPQVK